MRTVYLDELFLLNVGMDYLLLLCSARLAGERIRRGRMAAGALLGGTYAAAVLLPGWAWLGGWAGRTGCALLMALIGLGSGRRLLRQTAIFFAVACCFGGGILSISLLAGDGYVTDGRLILLGAAVCYALCSLVLRRLARHSAARGETVEVTLRLRQRRVTLPALVDTGNTLTDPVSGRAVIVVDAPAVSPLLEGTGPDARDLRAPAEALRRLDRGRWRGRFSLLPYRAVGVEHGLLLALRLDGAEIAGREQGVLLAALSPTPVSDGGPYRALIGREDAG